MLAGYKKGDRVYVLEGFLAGCYATIMSVLDAEFCLYNIKLDNGEVLPLESRYFQGV